MTDEMILVPRAELLAWAEEWQYENDPGDDTDCITPFDTYLLKSPAETQRCTCPSGDGSLRWPCPAHPPSAPVGVEGLPAKWRAEADEIAANNWSCNSNSIRARADELERVLAQQPAAVDGLNDWRAAFVTERAKHYRERGMSIEQARILAETDAACMEALKREADDA